LLSLSLSSSLGQSKLVYIADMCNSLVLQVNMRRVSDRKWNAPFD
jgi:hypothetical protein